MASVTKASDGTFSVNPQGDTAVALATENTYLNKNIVFNIDTPFVTNPNLLDNWYFGNPVNSYGLTSYSSGSNSSGGCIDRWGLSYRSSTPETTCLINIDSTNKYMTLKNNTYSTSSRASFHQKFYHKNYNFILGKKVTASLLDASGNIYQGTVTMGSTMPTSYFETELISNTKFKIVLAYALGEGEFQIIPLADLNVQAVKLELGDKQTLAHKEGNIWVLNEMMDEGEEKAKIQFKDDYTGIFKTSYVNPNILDNWLFTKEYRINQRGRADNGSCPMGEYVVDRWQNFHGSSFWLDNNAIVLFPESTSKWASLTQFIPNLPAGEYTASVLGQYGDFYTHTFNFIPNSAPTEYSFDSVHKLAMGTTDGRPYLSVIAMGTSSVSFRVKAVKLELGSQQTLCHKEDDSVWTLNEIPNYAEQLSRCQRYFVRSGYAGSTSGIYPAKRIYAHVFTGAQFPVRMAEIPSVTIINPMTGNRGNACYWDSSADWPATAGWTGQDRFLISCTSYTGEVVPLYFMYEAVVAGYGG